MASERPMLLLDIDGVLNPWGFEERPAGFSEHMLFPDEAPILLATVHGEWLRELSARFDITWASGWGGGASALAGMLDIPAFPHVPMPPTPFAPDDKVPAVAAFVGDRPVAWIDDQIGEPARKWADGRGVVTLLVQVDHRTGLTRSVVDQLLAWADQDR